jgi:hypothetical protein
MDVIKTDIVRLVISRFSDDGIETLSNVCVFDNDDLVFSCVGLELPFKNNEHQVSCIPIGSYSCEKVPATAHIPYEHISIMNVPNRDGICIHKANFVSQLLGCCCVGYKHVDINGDGYSDVTNSGVTFDKLMALLPDTFKVGISLQNSNTTV